MTGESYNFLHEIRQNEAHNGCYLFVVILTEIKFHFGRYVLCKHYPGFPIWVRLVVVEEHFAQNGPKLHKSRKSSFGRNGTKGKPILGVVERDPSSSPLH